MDYSAARTSHEIISVHKKLAQCSIIIPVFNEENCIIDTLERIKAMTDSFTDW